MNITFRQLQVFLSAAKHGGFTPAAKELHLTQPAVSMQIKQLEEALGAPMFEKQGRSVVLTEAGQVMRHYALDIAAKMEEARTAIDEFSNAEGGVLKVSVVTTVNCYAANAVAQFVKQHPAVKVRLQVNNRAEVLHQLDHNQTDLVIMGKPPESDSIEAQAFMKNPLVVVAAPDHPLATQPEVELAELVRYAFIMREEGSGTSAAFKKLIAEQGLGLGDSMEMNSNEAIKQAVAAGLGLGVVSMHTVEQELKHNQLVVVKAAHFPIDRDWYVAYKKDRFLPAVAGAFREFVLGNQK